MLRFEFLFESLDLLGGREIREMRVLQSAAQYRFVFCRGENLTSIKVLYGLKKRNQPTKKKKTKKNPQTHGTSTNTQNNQPGILQKSVPYYLNFLPFRKIKMSVIFSKYK